MRHVMLDLETMSTRPDAAIVAIGAVAFDPIANKLGAQFYEPVDLASAMAQGGQVDASTITWWLQQDDAARQAVAKTDARAIHLVLARFTCWLEDVAGPEFPSVLIWGDGAAFDNVILGSAYRRANMAQPWAYWNDRCYRTVKALHRDIEMQRVGVPHHAGDDAESQALHLLEIFQAYPSTAASAVQPIAGAA